MNGWKSMESAPRNGTIILVARNNGCNWKYYVVWWDSSDYNYPWFAGYNSFTEDRFDCWREIEEPYEIEDTDFCGGGFNK